MKINIAGGGPIGLYAGYLLSKKGFNVTLFEEHKVIGKPVACSGLLTQEIKKFRIDLTNSAVNRFESVSVHSKNIDLTFKNKDLLVDRFLFDNEILSMAKSEGVKIKFGQKHSGIRGKEDILIGADGPLSNVAKHNGLFNERKFYVGMQGIARGSFDSSCYDSFFDAKLVNDFFYWSIPESNKISRAGIASQKKAKQKYDVLFKKFKLKNTIAGLIPIYKPFCKCSNESKNVYLIGDAAGLLKNTTGGGIISGLESARLLCKAICEDKKYDELLFPLHKQLIVHNLIRKMLNKCSDKDYDELFSYLKQKKIKKIVDEINREKPLSSLMSIAMNEPRLLKFILKAT